MLLGVVIVAPVLVNDSELYQVQLMALVTCTYSFIAHARTPAAKKTAIISVIAVFANRLSNQGISTSIEPSAVMLTWLVPASTSGVTGAASMLAAFIIIGARMYGCG